MAEVGEGDITGSGGNGWLWLSTVARTWISNNARERITFFMCHLFHAPAPQQHTSQHTVTPRWEAVAQRAARGC